MSDIPEQPQQFTLNRSFDATRHDDGDGTYWLVDIPMDDQGGIWDKDFKEWAVPVVSVDNLQQQIAEIIDEVYSFAHMQGVTAEMHEQIGVRDFGLEYDDPSKGKYPNYNHDYSGLVAERIVSLIQGQQDNQLESQLFEATKIFDLLTDGNTEKETK